MASLVVTVVVAAASVKLHIPRAVCESRVHSEGVFGRLGLDDEDVGGGMSTYSAPLSPCVSVHHRAQEGAVCAQVPSRVGFKLCAR